MIPQTSNNFPKFSIAEALGVLNSFEKKNAPETAYYFGDLDLLKCGGRVSVVGSRKPTPEGVRRAQVVTKKLVEQGVVVVSGLAEGIDTIAHTTAIQCQGKTIAVLGTPLNNPYPKSNHGLFEKLVNEHLVISQFPINSPFQPKNFPIRNRTMALISHATIIIEATEKSGTVHQGWEALRLGRPLYLLENIVQDTKLTWPHEMIKYGAQVLNKDNFDQLFYTLPSSSLFDEQFDF